MKRYQVALIAVAVLLAIGFVGNMDFQDEVREQIAYCENVKAGTWPDYNGTFATECTPDNLKKLSEFLR